MSYPKENDLVLSCCFLSSQEEKKIKIQQLLKFRLDWEYIYKKSVSDGLTPLVYMCLSRDGLKELVDKTALEKLRRQYLINLMRNTILVEELDRLLQRLNTTGIRTMLLGGMAILKTVYSDIALRPMADIDILIDRNNFSGWGLF